MKDFFNSHGRYHSNYRDAGHAKLKPADSFRQDLCNRAIFRPYTRPCGDNMSFTRRELLERCAAFGAITLWPLRFRFPPSLTRGAKPNRDASPTPTCELGPFYKSISGRLPKHRCCARSAIPVCRWSSRVRFTTCAAKLSRTPSSRHGRS